MCVPLLMVWLPDTRLRLHPSGPLGILAWLVLPSASTDQKHIAALTRLSKKRNVLLHCLSWREMLSAVGQAFWRVT
jgi:hypothetical protein